MRYTSGIVAAAVAGLMLINSVSAQESSREDLAQRGWKPLFNGRNLSGWTVGSDAGEEVWRVINGVIDCTPKAGVEGDLSLWTEQEFEDFKLRVDWRIKETKGEYPMPIVQADGTYKTDEDGEVIEEPRPNADSGILLRGTSKAQVNIWRWPVGSGEVYGYRTDGSMPAEVKAAVTPKIRADRPVGEWNTFEITMADERMTVVLNGETVIENARLPGVPEEGPIGLQHHGGYDEETGEWSPASSLVQFRNIYIKEL